MGTGRLGRRAPLREPGHRSLHLSSSSLITPQTAPGAREVLGALDPTLIELVRTTVADFGVGIGAVVGQGRRERARGHRWTQSRCVTDQ